ncbi:unnamed protein product [Paramecium sonneborni]|uniref:Transmembrane protein n=1 Tax=Paramecium sonneborni TaxID=65129 RepID=A0A8S1RMR6_9CILI|nr:unnamed protein product [Paramecium sonneborni]
MELLVLDKMHVPIIKIKCVVKQEIQMVNVHSHLYQQFQIEDANHNQDACKSKPKICKWTTKTNATTIIITLQALFLIHYLILMVLKVLFALQSIIFVYLAIQSHFHKILAIDLELINIHLERRFCKIYPTLFES